MTQQPQQQPSSSTHRHTYEGHVKSLQNLPNGRCGEWRITLHAASIGEYDLIINFPKEFPDKAPQVQIDSALEHPYVNVNGQFVVEELGENWSRKRLIGETVNDVIGILKLNPPKYRQTISHDHENSHHQHRGTDAHNHTQELKDELATQRELVKIVQSQKEELEKNLTALRKENERLQFQLTNMHEQIHQLKHGKHHQEEKIKEKEEKTKEKEQIIKEREENLKKKEEALEGRDEAFKNLQLKYMQLTNELEKREKEVQKPSTAPVEELDCSLRIQIETLKGQLIIKDEKVKEFDQINELNDRLEKQNKSLSDCIKVLDKKIEERDTCVSLLKAANQYLGEQQSTVEQQKAKIEEERNLLCTQLKEKTQLLQFLEEKQKELQLKLTEITLHQAEFHPNVHERKKESEEEEKLRQELQSLQETTYKEKQALQKRMQELEQSLANALKSHAKCEESNTPKNDSGNEEILKEIIQIQSQIHQYNQDLKKEIQDAGASLLAFRQDVEMVMKQLNVDECNLNLKVAKLIQSDSVHRKMFEWVIGKFKMIFSDCRVVLSQYVDTKPEFGNSVANSASQIIEFGAMLLNNIPTIGLILQLTEFVLNICGDMRLRDLFENVSKFENKILPENTSAFAKIFALQLFDMKEFQEEKQKLEEAKGHEQNGNAKNKDKWLQDMVENYCDRALVVLTTGVMGNLWDNTVSRRSPRRKLSGNCNNSGFNVVCILEQVMTKMLPALSVGSTMKEFKEQLKKKCEAMNLEEEELGTLEEVTPTTDANTEGKNPESKPTSKDLRLPLTSIGMSDMSKQLREKKILKEGFMEKEGAYVFSHSQKRKFTLLSDGTLTYAKENGKNILRYNINLLQAKAIKRWGTFGLIVETQGRNWIFTCNSIIDRDDWFTTIGTIPGVKCYNCEVFSKKNSIKESK